MRRPARPLTPPSLLSQQFLDDDQVELIVFGRIEVVRVGSGQVLPCRVVDQVVLGVGAHERDQVRDALEAIQVVVFAQERLPLVAGIPPARSPQRVAVTSGQAQADGYEVSNHAAQNSDGG